RGCLGLLVLDADERGLVLQIGEIDFGGAIGEQRNQHDREENRDVFEEQPYADPEPCSLFQQRTGVAPRPRSRAGDMRGDVVRLDGHSITSPARPANRNGPARLMPWLTRL